MKSFDDSILDYEFDFGGTPLRVKHSYCYAVVIDRQGKEWAHIQNNNFELWPDKEAMPKNVATSLMVGYFQGVTAGGVNGYERCQRDMRKLLGLEGI